MWCKGDEECQATLLPRLMCENRVCIVRFVCELKNLLNGYGGVRVVRCIRRS